MNIEKEKDEDEKASDEILRETNALDEELKLDHEEYE